MTVLNWGDQSSIQYSTCRLARAPAGCTNPLVCSSRYSLPSLLQGYPSDSSSNPAHLLVWLTATVFQPKLMDCYVPITFQPWFRKNLLTLLCFLFRFCFFPMWAAREYWFCGNCSCSALCSLIGTWVMLEMLLGCRSTGVFPYHPFSPSLSWL